MIDVVIIGAGGFGRETLDVLEAVNQESSELVYRILGVVDDLPSEVNLERLAARGYQHLGSIQQWCAHRSGDAFLPAVGDPESRRSIVELIHQVPTLDLVVHPSVSIGSGLRAGGGSVICAQATISTNVVIGSFVHINPGVIIGHDVVIDDFVSVNPGAVISGEVKLSSEVLVGAGSTILQGLSVGERSVVGAAACVTKAIPAGVIAKGVPATW
jgi:sugar O-acyltransferase (sialic acid O-acetyltransferase NeuD family)